MGLPAVHILFPRINIFATKRFLFLIFDSSFYSRYVYATSTAIIITRERYEPTFEPTGLFPLCASKREHFHTTYPYNIPSFPIYNQKETPTLSPFPVSRHTWLTRFICSQNERVPKYIHALRTDLPPPSLFGIISNPFHSPPPLADYWNENERRERWPPEVDKYPRLVLVISCRHFPRAATVNFVRLPRCPTSRVRSYASNMVCVAHTERRSRMAIGMYRRRRHGRKGTMRRQLRWNSASARRRASVLRFPTSIPVHYSFHSYGMWPFTGDASSIFINLESRLRISASAPRRIRIDLIKSVRF